MVERVAGRYDLHEKIGSGGMGSVWLAYDHKQARWVAAKVLKHTDAAMVLRFVREQGLRVQHPHVVAPAGWAADDDKIVLSMDLVRGGSVDGLLQAHGALPESYAAVLLDQLLDALAAVHAKGIVHRDVKPANLLLDPTGIGRPFLRLSDFGIALITSEPRLTQTAMSIGSLGYMAPEQAMGGEPDPRSDLYAVGIVGRQMITGLPPRALPPAYPGSRLWPFLMELCQPVADRRPPTAEAARSALQRWGVPADDPWRTEPNPPHVAELVSLPADPTPADEDATVPRRESGEVGPAATARYTPSAPASPSPASPQTVGAMFPLPTPPSTAPYAPPQAPGYAASPAASYVRSSPYPAPNPYGTQSTPPPAPLPIAAVPVARPATDRRTLTVVAAVALSGAVLLAVLAALLYFL